MLYKNMFKIYMKNICFRVNVTKKKRKNLKFIIKFINAYLIDIL